jgi:hypothetical protein
MKNEGLILKNQSHSSLRGTKQSLSNLELPFSNCIEQTSIIPHEEEIALFLAMTLTPNLYR